MGLCSFIAWRVPAKALRTPLTSVPSPQHSSRNGRQTARNVGDDPLHGVLSPGAQG